MVSPHDSLNTLESKDHYVITPNLKFRDFKKEYLKKNKLIKNCKKIFVIIVKKTKNFLASWK